MGDNQGMRRGISLRTKLTLLALLALLGGVGAALFIAFTDDDLANPALEILLHVTAGWAWIGTGIFAWWRRPDNSYGRWMTATGFAWLAQSLIYANTALLFTAGILFADLFALILVQTMLRFPTGRIEAPLERRIADIVTGVVVLLFASTMFANPKGMGSETSPANLLMVVDSPTTLTVLLILVNVAAVGLALLLIRSFIAKYGQAGPPGRRLLGPVLWTSTALLGSLGLASLFSIAGLDGPERVARVMTGLSVIAVPVAFLIGLFRSRLIQGAMMMVMIPAAMMVPNSSWAPSCPGLDWAMWIMGPTGAKLTPMMTGSLMPNHWVAPRDWMMVAMPQANRSAAISRDTSCESRPSARPMIRGTATAPAYITSTCCSPRADNWPNGRISSTGATVLLMSCLQGAGRARAGAPLMS